MFLRLTSVILLLVSVIFLPWWLWLVMAAGLMFLLPAFWEAIPILFVSDLIFGVPEGRFFGSVFATLIVGIVIYLLINLFKKYLRQ